MVHARCHLSVVEAILPLPFVRADTLMLVMFAGSFRLFFQLAVAIVVGIDECALQGLMDWSGKELARVVLDVKVDPLVFRLCNHPSCYSYELC